MSGDDPNEIMDRIAARLGSFTHPLLNAVYQVAADVAEVEWRAEESGEADVIQSATELRRQIEAGTWDASLDVARKGAGELAARMAVWDAMDETDRCRVQFIWALRDERHRTGGADFWTHAPAFAKSRDWGFGSGEPAIKRALEVADAYGVSLGDLGPGKPRGTSGGWGRRTKS